ncbi:MAG: hypothetical protein U0R70_00480 [Solirubrobacteraceae bacterium]
MQRKLDIGTTISQVFATYGAQAAVLLPAAAVIFIPLAIISGILRNNGSIILGLLATLVSIVGTYWYAGIVVNAVRDIRDGRRDLSLGELFAASAPYILPLFGAAVIFGICVFVSAIFFVIPGIVLGVFWCLFAPAIVVERVGVFRSFGRSIELVKGNWWAIFAVFLLFLLMLIVAAIVLGAIFFAIIDSVAGRIIADAITNILFAPLSAIVVSVIYFNIAGDGQAAGPGPGAAPAPAGLPGAPSPGPEMPGIPGDPPSIPGGPPPSTPPPSAPPPGS